MDQTLLPFDISFESLETKEHFLAGFNYSFAEMRIYLSRNNLKSLIGSFFVPTVMFSFLSLISFSINPDIVSLCTYILSIICFTYRTRAIITRGFY